MRTGYVSNQIRDYKVLSLDKDKKFKGKKFVVKNKYCFQIIFNLTIRLLRYQDLTSDEYSWLVFFLPQLAAFLGQMYIVLTEHLAINGRQDLILAIFGVFFVPMAFVNSGLPSMLKKESKILSFWGAVISGKEWTVIGEPKNRIKPKDAFYRMCADVLINFVYPTCVPRLTTSIFAMISGHRFLFMVLPVFIARSASYMDAITAATSVFFAVQWDAESEGEEFRVKLPISEPEPNRSEA